LPLIVEAMPLKYALEAKKNNKLLNKEKFDNLKQKRWIFFL